MLYSCSFRNFTSFADDVYFDLAAPKNRVRNRYPGNYTTFDSGELVLKDAVLVGENAGGKSNYVTVFKFLRSLFARNDVIPRSYNNLIFSANLLHKPDELLPLAKTTQPFEVELVLDDCALRYTLHLDSAGIKLEQLERREKSNSGYQAVFTLYRESDALTACEDCSESTTCDIKEAGKGCWNYRVICGSELRIPQELIDNLVASGVSADNLMVTSLAMLREPSCRALVSWFTSDLVIASRSKDGFSIEGISSDETERILADERYFDIIKLVDQSISKIKVDRDRPFQDSVLVRTSAAGNEFERPLSEDSTGVIHFAQWAVAIYLVVYGNKTVFADEIDSAINPVLSDRVLAFINGTEHKGQFIFTTHNALNLTFRTFMKEQMYFVTKDVETLASSMYSLADFGELRYDVKGEIYDLYLRGVLGGTQDA